MTANRRPERPQHDSPGQRPGFDARIVTKRCKRATTSAMVACPDLVSAVFKPACRGRSKTYSSMFAPVYSWGYSRLFPSCCEISGPRPCQSPSQSESVRPFSSIFRMLDSNKMQQHVLAPPIQESKNPPIQPPKSHQVAAGSTFEIHFGPPRPWRAMAEKGGPGRVASRMSPKGCAR